MALAELLHAMFVELVFAPGFDDDALEVLTQKPNIRLLETQERRDPPITEQDLKRVRGGVLVQDRDTGSEDRLDMQVVTERKPTEAEWGELQFAMAGVQARALERDRAGQGPGHRRGGRGPDEPRRLRAHRGREGPGRGHT